MLRQESDGMSKEWKQKGRVGRGLGRWERGSNVKKENFGRPDVQLMEWDRGDPVGWRIQETERNEDITHVYWFFLSSGGE